MTWTKRVLRCLLVALLLGSASAEELWETAPGRERIFNALVTVFEDNYWDAAYRDWDVWAEGYRAQAVDANTRVAFESTLRRMVNELGDDHSRFVGLPQSARRGLDGGEEIAEPGMGFRHAFVAGVGLVVERVFPETPAAEAGLHRGDLIESINAQTVTGAERSGSVSRLLQEAAASGQVTFEVRRSNARLLLNLEPRPLDFDYVQDLPQAEMLTDATGYLYIPTFSGAGTAEEVHRLLADLREQGAQSLVLDLRDNLGGRLGELGLVLGAFIDGPWVEAVSRDNVVWRSSYLLEGDEGRNVLEDADGAPFARNSLASPAKFSGPVSVIVSRRNSSAGEVAALVLQELGRATVVGEATSGNVEAIQGFDLPDGSLVYVAVANLQGTSGLDFSVGVQPDVRASASLQDLARGYDAPVAEAVRSLKGLPFTPGKFF